MNAKRRSEISTVVLVALCVVGCTSDPAPPAGMRHGVAQTGGEAPTEPLAGPTDGQLHEARVKSVLARSELAGEAELAKWRGAPLVEARVELDRGGFTGHWSLSGVNGGTQALRVVAFELPVNRLAGRQAAVTLTSARVGGKAVTAGGTAARWEIPVEVAPGQRVELELEFAGTPPRVRGDDVVALPGASLPGSNGLMPQGKLDLAAVLGQVGNSPELRQLVPVVPVIDVAQAFAQFEGGAVLSGCLPTLSSEGAGLGSVGVISIEVLVAAERTVDATGLRGASERDGTRMRHRFVALGAADIAIVVTRGLRKDGEASTEGLVATDVLLADVPVTLRVPAAATAALKAQLRRALEELEVRWGAHGPTRLTVVGLDRVGSDDSSGPAIGRLPGIVLVPTKLLETAAADDPGAAAGAPGPTPGLSLSGMLGAMIEHHPAAREALAFAVATAVAQEWWAGVGRDDAAQNILSQGFARAGALAIVAGKAGDKAERRALEFGLRLPIQLALEQGGKDIALAGMSRSNGAATSTLAALKAGLFVHTLARQLGEPTMAALVARLFAARGVTLEAFRSEVLALAPRPDETRAFMARWLDETHLAEDVGPFRPEVLLEYFVADGAVGSLTSQLMGQLGPDQLGGHALELLAQGKGLDAGMALTLLGDLAGKNVDPSIKKWLTLGTGLLGGGNDRKKAVERLVDVLGAELGIPESDRSRLRQLSAMLFEELAKETTSPESGNPSDPAAPPAPRQP